MAIELLGFLGAVGYIGLGITAMLWAGRPRAARAPADRTHDATQCPPWLIALGGACRLAGPWWMYGMREVRAARMSQRQLQGGQR